MKLLVIGHSLIIDSNRTFWAIFAKKNQATVDLVAPAEWSSNLKKDIKFSLNNSDQTFNNLFKVPVFIKGNGSLFFYHPWSIFKIFYSNRYDAIFLNQETWTLSVLLIILIKNLSPNRQARLYLCVAQNLKKEHLKFLHPYERFISNFIHHFLYCSKGVEEVLRWKGIKTPCTYFPLPYDDFSYKAAQSTKNNNLFLIGYLGRLSEDKGIPILLAACDQLQKEHFNFKLLIGGNGPLSEEVKSKSYVEFLGLIPHHLAFQFYEKIDCFILPSQTTRNWMEQFGRVIVESFGAGRPVIGSSSGSIPEVLGKLQWPWIFNESSSIDLVEMIKKLSKYLDTSEGQLQLQKSIALNKKLFSQSEVALSIYPVFLN